ncbi:MAG: hypothetical protein ACOC9Z_09285 [Chloroflexota bacterium]
MDEQQVFTAVPPRQLWFGVAAGPILWAIQLVVVYALVSLACNWRFFSFTLLGVPGIVVILTTVTLVLSAIVLYAGLLSWHNWRVIQEEEHAHGRREERHYFLAYSGVLLSALFLLVMLVSLIPAFVLGPCAVV